MNEIQLASNYTGKFNEEITPYISTSGYNKLFMIHQPEYKIIYNLDFSDFSLSNLHLNENIKHIHFKKCRFHNVISEGLIIDSKFTECTFNDIDLYEISVGLEFEYCSIGKFKIHSSELINQITVRNTRNENIGTFEIYDCIFKSAFNLSNIGIHFLTIYNTDFEKTLNFNNVVVHDECDLKEINFKDLALFDDCTFNAKAQFKYVIFEKFTSFRGSKFNKGINLEYTSSDKEINFYGIEISDKNTTSQETYRIIKNQFEKLNNKIEANKYHALEMEQHRKSVWKNMFNCNSFFKLLPDGIVSFVHWLSSNHSSNWFLALIWIFVVSLITNVSLGYGITVDNIFKYINILSKIEDFNNSYIAMTLNKVSLGYLYYQFLTAVRKDTRK